jgi:arabinogalactan oligomer/maltooligosaccharide transport system substrate-binding protein
MARLVGSIVIWHSWDESEVNALWTVISAFQGMFPNIGFDLLYVPPDELKQQYEVAVARGSGPSVLLAPAEWGPDYYEKELVVDFTPYVNPDFLATLNPAGLASGQYQGALISIPYALRGVVLYRNTAIIPQPAATFDELISLAQAATHDGAVGAVLERSLFYSAAHLNGLGGQMMDASGNPAFNNLLGLGWVGLLRSFEQAGVAVFNSNRDVQLFKQGKAGFIIDTSWNRGTLAAAIGAENLAIDPWPTFGNGHLSGFVQADSVYLNPNLAGDSHTAALQFIGYLLAPEVQAVLAEVGHVPSGKTVSVRDPLVQQAMTALAGGTAYPLLPEADAYWVPLEAALLDIFERGVDPATALQQAYDAVNTRLAEIRAAQP